MKIEEMLLEFPANGRPIVKVLMEGDLAKEAKGIKYTMRTSHEYKANMYYGEAGDFVSCLTKREGTDKRLLANEVAMNMVFTDKDPVMGALVEDSAGNLIDGHMNVLAAAKYLACYSNKVAIAAVEWPSGIRVYEPVLLADNSQPNREGDRIIFLAATERATLH